MEEYGCIARMQEKIFAGLIGAMVIGAGCIDTVSGRKTSGMVFLKDKTLTRYFPDIRTQGVVFVIILFACPAPIYDKDQVLGVAGAGRRSQRAAGPGTLFQEQPSMHSRTFQSAKVARHNSIFNLGFTDCLAVFA